MDILCLGYAALRPQWPRPAIAISHRSRTVKPLLFNTPFWRSPFAAIDATYIPQWETNIAMIWGLFASAPAIVRMPSKEYSESEWCQRESELIDFVTIQYDFIRNRHLIDLEESAAPHLNELLAPPARIDIQMRRTVRSISPPMLTESEAALMSAAGAVRLSVLRPKEALNSLSKRRGRCSAESSQTCLVRPTTLLDGTTMWRSSSERPA